MTPSPSIGTNVWYASSVCLYTAKSPSESIRAISMDRAILVNVVNSDASVKAMVLVAREEVWLSDMAFSLMRFDNIYSFIVSKYTSLLVNA